MLRIARSRRSTKIAAAAVITAAGTAALAIPAATASAAASSPAKLAAASSSGSVSCTGWTTGWQSGNGVLRNWWAQTADAHIAGSDVGTCVGAVRETVHYPRSETLTWSVSVNGKRVGTKRVYGRAGSTHYWTWHPNKIVGELNQECISAGSNWSCQYYAHLQ